MFEFFEIAARLATSKDDRRDHRLGAVARRSDGALVTAYNGSPQFPVASAHAEYRLARKIDCGSIVWIARITKDGKWAMAKPCHNCERLLRARRVHTVYYTIGPNEYGCLRLKK